MRSGIPWRSRWGFSSTNGGLASKVMGNTLAVFGRRDNGHLTRLSWMPGDGGLWTEIDITALA